MGFTIAFHETDVTDMGTVHPETGAAVNLPIRDFTDMYRMVQTQKLITGEVDADENNKVTFFRMSAHDSPVGEVSTNVP